MAYNPLRDMLQAESETMTVLNFKNDARFWWNAAAGEWNVSVPATARQKRLAAKRMIVHSFKRLAPAVRFFTTFKKS